MKHGMGLDGFVWFEGQVEDRLDPLRIGRVRVRCLGFDSDHQEDMPTSTLPWAYPLLPLNSDQGSVHAPKEGTWVFGFFRDGEDAQDRVVVGTINTGYNKWKSDRNDPASAGDKKPAAILELDDIPLVPDVAGVMSSPASPKAVAAEMTSQFSDQFGMASAEFATEATSVTASAESLAKAQEEVKAMIAGGAELSGDVVAFAELSPADLESWSEGSSHPTLPTVGEFTAAAGALSGVTKISGFNVSSIQSINDASNAALGAADNALNLVGGTVDTLNDLSNVNLSDLDLTDVSGAATLIGGKAVGEALAAVDKIPGGIDNLIDNISEVDVGGLGASGLNAGVSMALAQPEVQKAVAAAVSALNTIKTLQKTQETALSIISKAKNII